MKKNNSYAYIVYDLETGGLDEEKNPIVELAFVPVLRNKQGKLYIDEKLSFDSLVLPYNSDLKIETTALKRNNISIKEIKEYGNDVENIKEVLLDLIKILNPTGNERYRPVLVGHNISKFDNNFLKKFLKDIGAPEMYTLFSKSCLDTLELTKFMYDGEGVISSYALGSLCDFFHIKMKNKHRALDDAIANAKLFIRLSEMFKINRRELMKIVEEEKQNGNSKIKK